MKWKPAAGYVNEGHMFLFTTGHDITKAPHIFMQHGRGGGNTYFPG